MVHKFTVVIYGRFQSILPFYCLWFSETLICYIRERINQVTKGLKLNSSKRTKNWTDFHQIRLDPSGPMRTTWKELLKCLGITGTEVDPLLEQSVYDKIFTILVSEYFSSQTDHSTDPTSRVSTPVELGSFHVISTRCRRGWQVVMSSKQVN